MSMGLAPARAAASRRNGARSKVPARRKARRARRRTRCGMACVRKNTWCCATRTRRPLPRWRTRCSRSLRPRVPCSACWPAGWCVRPGGSSAPSGSRRRCSRIGRRRRKSRPGPDPRRQWHPQVRQPVALSRQRAGRVVSGAAPVAGPPGPGQGDRGAATDAGQFPPAKPNEPESRGNPREMASSQCPGYDQSSAAVSVGAEVTRQTVLPTSSATSSAPGRRSRRPPGARAPRRRREKAGQHVHRVAAGRPSSNGTKITL